MDRPVKLKKLFDMRKSFYAKACRYDCINTTSVFCVFSDGNPYAAAYSRTHALFCRVGYGGNT